MKASTKEKIIIPLSKCLPGMMLLQPIVDKETGTVLLPKDKPLTVEYIKKANNFDHTEVWVDINAKDSHWQTNQETLLVYRKYATMLKEIVGDDYRIGVINLTALKELATSIVEGFHSDFDLLSCVNLVKELDEDCFTHSINVAFLGLLVGRWNGYNHTKLEQIVEAALLHDVGKLDLPGYKQSESVRARIKEELAYRRHPIYGYERLVKYNELDNEVLKAVLTHHERCDGSGFPLSLRADRISDIASIIGLADEYDTYRKENSIFKVIKYLRTTCVRGFPSELLVQFCRRIMSYYIGSTVLLSTGDVGEICSISHQIACRPLIKLKDTYLDLHLHQEIDIVKIIS